MSDIIWGDEIAVNGKRPEWLADDQAMQYQHRIEQDGNWGNSPARHWNWNNEDWQCVTAIRLPADHPHYATLSAPTAPNTPAGYSDEVVGRISRALRAYARNDPSLILTGKSIAAELYALADLLPEPADGDLAEARELEAIASERNGFHDYAKALRAGEYDDDGPVRCTLNGIRRGRALAASEAS